MTAVDEQLTTLLRERAGEARPEPDLAAVLSGVRRVGLIADESRARRWERFIGIAAAIAVAGAGTVLAVERHRASDSSTPADRPVVIYPDRVPAAPLTEPGVAPSFGALTASLDGTGLVVQRNADSVPLFSDGSPTQGDTPWDTWPLGAQTVTDVDVTSPAATYVATCCAPGGIIWRNGQANTTGTHIDYVLDGVLRATVDPASSTARIGDLVTHEPSVLDVTVLDQRSAVLLVAEPSPHLVVVSADEFAATAKPDRRTVMLPDGPNEPCGIVALEQAILVLVGGPNGVDECVSDRAFVIEPHSGVVMTTMRLPTPVRAINSDHHAHVIAVTAQGDVVIGLIAPSEFEPSWTTVLEGDYLAAYLL